MQKLIILIAIFIFTTLSSNAQNTAKVIGENVATSDELAKQKIETKQIMPLENEYDDLIKKLDLGWTRGKRGFGTDDVNTINRLIGENQAILDKINSNPRLKSLINQLNSLYKQVNSNITIGSEVTNNEKVAKENIRHANARLDELNGRKDKLKEEDKKDNELQSVLDDLDMEIQQQEQASKGAKKEVDDYNKLHKDKSLDDFLGESGKTNNSGEMDDFLSEESTEQSSEDDFLAVADKENEAVESEKTAKIDSKNNTQGVIDSKNRILIPYRNWTITEYKEGIAKVKIEVAQTSCNGSYTAYKVGFVDKSGDFLDSYKIDFSSFSDYYNYPLLKLNRMDKRDSESYEDYYARKDREKRASERCEKEEKQRKRLEAARCEKEISSWKSGIINQYK